MPILAELREEFDNIKKPWYKRLCSAIIGGREGYVAEVQRLLKVRGAHAVDSYNIANRIQLKEKVPWDYLAHSVWMNALEISSKYRDIAVVGLLLQQNGITGTSDPKMKLYNNELLQRPLRMAAYSHRSENVKLLVAAIRDRNLNLESKTGIPFKKSNLNAKDAGGMTALHLATDKHYSELESIDTLAQRAEVVEVLLGEERLNPNILSGNASQDKRYTALYFAAVNGFSACVKLLVNDKRTEVNKSPSLIMAVYRGHEEVIKLLLAHDETRLDFTDEKKDGSQTKKRTAQDIIKEGIGRSEGEALEKYKRMNALFDEAIERRLMKPSAKRTRIRAAPPQSSGSAI